MGTGKKQDYAGFEQGPIRPPSEANSLLVRVTRNCPWNRCTFCSVYKGDRFSLRPVEHVIRDIDQVHAAVSALLAEADENGALSAERLDRVASRCPPAARPVFDTAVNWLFRGEGSVFLQDANSLIIKTDHLVQVLDHLRARFPWITRVTSYARSHTINRVGEDKVRRLAAAGLNRIHVGMESGSDAVLERIAKGTTKAGHIAAGKIIRNCGIELSEYVMPGLAGRELSEEHARETADALNQIDADFIRLRTLSPPPGTPLYDEMRSGAFERCTDMEIVREVRLFLETLDGITSTVKSDHFYNLLEGVEGRLPEDKAGMLGVIDAFLALPARDRVTFQLGRRLGYFRSLADMSETGRLGHVEAIRERWQATPDNIDAIIAEKQAFSI